MTMGDRCGTVLYLATLPSWDEIHESSKMKTPMKLKLKWQEVIMCVTVQITLIHHNQQNDRIKVGGKILNFVDGGDRNEPLSFEVEYGKKLDGAGNKVHLSKAEIQSFLPGDRTTFSLGDARRCVPRNMR